MKKTIIFLFFVLSLGTILAQKNKEIAVVQHLKAHNPTLLKTLKPLGHFEPDSLVDVIIELPFRNEEELVKRFRDVSDPKSPDYRNYLTPEAFTEQFGPSELTWHKLLAFVKSNGLEIINAPSNRALVHVRARSRIMEKVFHLRFMKYENPISKKTFHAPVGEPMLAIDILKLEIYGLNDYEKTLSRKSGMGISVAGDNSTNMRVGSASDGDFIGDDFRNAYLPDALDLTGEGETVGVLTSSDFYEPDINTYEMIAGRGKATIDRIYMNGLQRVASPHPARPGSGMYDPESEISMDIEMVLAMAPAAHVNVYGQPLGYLSGDMLNEIANPTKGEILPHQITTSVNLNYGGDDSPRVYHAYYQMGIQGQSFFAYSGDDAAYADPGLPGIQPYSPGDFPYVTSVGGTVLTMSGNGVSYAAESGWSSSGGGPSPWFSIPWYQVGVSNLNNLASVTHRNCPDVSMPAFRIFIVSNGGGQFSGYGTSAATPLWAGFMALVNEQAARHQLPPVGFLNPSLYQIGRLGGYTACFHDIRDGSSNAQSATGANPAKYKAVAGYDLVTGWGSPNGLNFINAVALREPDPLDITLAYVSDNSNGCDFGPIAGNEAFYRVAINAGTGPYAYTWSMDHLLPVNSGTMPQATINVFVPPIDQSGTLTILVTDANGSKRSASITIVGANPVVANRSISFCNFWHQVMANIRPPVYVNPGDPFKYRKARGSPFSPQQLKKFDETLLHLTQNLKSLSIDK